MMLMITLDCAGPNCKLAATSRVSEGEEVEPLEHRFPGWMRLSGSNASDGWYCSEDCLADAVVGPR